MGQAQSKFGAKALSPLIIWVILGVVFTLGSNTPEAHAYRTACRDVFTEPVQRAKIYPKGIDPQKEPDGFMQFSYESEYTIAEAAPLLRDYAPAPALMHPSLWHSMTAAQRMDWLKSRFVNKPEFAVSSGLIKQVDNALLPNELIVDSTGNLEIVINPPLNNYRSWERVVDTVVGRYGPGSQQAMISKPRRAAYGIESRNRELEANHLGWLNFTNLFDMFQKLKSGYQRYLKDPSKLTALSFDHPFLGPMNAMKNGKLIEYLKQNASGQNYDDNSKEFVRKNDASFKYTSGPSYRPDIAGPTRWSWEIRNSHKDVEDLKNKVRRDINAHVHGLESYRPFAADLFFNTQTDFAKLPENVQNMLRGLFPTKADPRFNYKPEELMALETYRNFALPMKNHKELIIALSKTDDPASAHPNYVNLQEVELSESTSRAQIVYRTGLIQVERDLASGKITDMEAKARIMGLLGEWSVKSGLTEAFEKKAAEIGHDTTFAPALGEYPKASGDK